MIPTYLVGVGITDFAMLYGASNIARNNLNNIVNGIYYQHDTGLLEKYHLLAITEEKEILEDMIRPIAQNNLEQEPDKDLLLRKKNYLDMGLANFEIKIDKSGSLASPSILENQIIEYMKYKKILDIPIFIEEFIKDYNSAVEDGKVIKEKMAYDKKINKADARLDNIGRDFKVINESSDKINKIIDDYNQRRVDAQALEGKESLTMDERKIINGYGASRQNLANAINRINRQYSRLEGRLDEFIDFKKDLKKDRDQWQDYMENIENDKMKIIYKNGDFLSNLIFKKIGVDSSKAQLVYDQENLLEMGKAVEEEGHIYYGLGNYQDDPISKYLENKEKLKGEGDKNQAKNIKNKLTARVNSLFFKEKTGKKLFDFVSESRLDFLVQEGASLEETRLGPIRKGYSDSEKLENFMEVMGDSQKIEKTSGQGFLDNLLIADYIVSFFPNKLDDKEDFNSKQEYIIFGKEKLDENVDKANNRILLTRFLFNSVYAFTDGNIQTQTSLLATQLSAGFGFAIPLIQMVLIASLALGESLLDVDDLNQNKAVPIIKNKKTWKLGLTSIKNLSEEDLERIGDKFESFDTQDIFSNTVQSFILSEAIFEGDFSSNFDDFVKELGADLKAGDYDNLLVKRKLTANYDQFKNLAENGNVEEIGDYVEGQAQTLPEDRNSRSSFRMDYSNYLLLILLIKLNMGYKHEMLQRVALLIEADLAQYGYFDISRTYSEFRVDYQVFINTVYVHKIVNRKRGNYFDFSISKGFYEK